MNHLGLLQDAFISNQLAHSLSCLDETRSYDHNDVKDRLDTDCEYEIIDRETEQHITNKNERRKRKLVFRFCSLFVYALDKTNSQNHFMTTIFDVYTCQRLTRVGSRDVRNLVGVQPEPPLTTLQNRGSKPLLKL